MPASGSCTASRRALTLPIAGAALLAVVLTGSYRRVERVAIVVGLFEFAFFFVAWAAHPDPAAMAEARSTSRSPTKNICISQRPISAR